MEELRDADGAPKRSAGWHLKQALGGGLFTVFQHVPAMYEWWCGVTREHPLESAEYGLLTRNEQGLPQIEVTTTLRGGIRFSKAFVFEYLPVQDRWQAQFGLDLHLDPQWQELCTPARVP